MRTISTLAVILAMAVPTVACKDLVAPVAKDLPALPDGCPGFQVLEPRLMMSADYEAKPGDYKDNTRIDYASIPANEADLAERVKRADQAHAHMRKVTYLTDQAWDIRVFVYGRDGRWESFLGDRTPDGSWMIEALRGQEVRGPTGVTAPVTGKIIKGNLGTVKSNRLNEIIASACLLREPTHYDGGAPNGPGCSNGRDYLIEAKINGKTHAWYQGCRAHGMSGELAMILSSQRRGKQRSVTGGS